VNYDYEKIADDLLEISSQQRLGILLRLYDKNSKVAVIAKELDATVPEVFRNFGRLVKANLISKEPDGDYTITTYGKIVCNQIPSLAFLLNNKKYFKEHDFGDLPQKFLQRIGALESGQYIKGIVKVFEKWKDIYQNSNEYIFNILVDVPYDVDFLEPLVKKVSKGVKLNSIFSETAIIPKERKQALEKLGFKKLIQEGLIERKMRENVQIVVILNEKEASVMFPKEKSESDISEMFYGKDPAFHDWCLDYFKYCWDTSSSFQESKLKQE
jgi:predicted transcriptional regulator